jgi:PAS domain-containing protein
MQPDATGLDLPLAVLNLVALVGLGALVIGRHRATVRLEQRLAAAEAELATQRKSAAAAEARARLLDGVIAAFPCGVSVFDAELRLVAWNAGFSDLAGVPRRALRIGTPLKAILRLQAEGGEFGIVDPEAEAARRMAILKQLPLRTLQLRDRPDGSRLSVRRAPLPDGGFVTLYAPESAGISLPPDAGLASAFLTDWQDRLPRLMAALEAGDAVETRALAHALRGIALHAGWRDLTNTLDSIENAARKGDIDGARRLGPTLPRTPGA